MSAPIIFTILPETCCTQVYLAKEFLIAVRLCLGHNASHLRLNVRHKSKSGSKTSRCLIPLCLFGTKHPIDQVDKHKPLSVLFTHFTRFWELEVLNIIYPFFHSAQYPEKFGSYWTILHLNIQHHHSNAGHNVHFTQRGVECG